MIPGRLWLLVPEPLRRLPADLAAVVVLVILTDLSVLVPVVNESPLRVVFGLVFVLFLPGYAVVAALFPEAGESPTADDATAEWGDASDDTDAESDDDGWPSRDRGIDGIERVALSFGLSVAIVPLIGVVLHYTPWGIRLVPILLSISAVTIVGVGIATVRRWDLDHDERFRVPYRHWIAGGGRGPSIRTRGWTPH